MVKIILLSLCLIGCTTPEIKPQIEYGSNAGWDGEIVIEFIIPF